MAYDLHLAERIDQIMRAQKVSFYEKKMMGGITWMVDDKMCIGIFKENLMARVDPAEIEELLTKSGVTQMTMGGKVMKGYLVVTPQDLDNDADLEFWIIKCLEFNPKAKSSKKRNK